MAAQLLFQLSAGRACTFPQPSWNLDHVCISFSVSPTILANFRICITNKMWLWTPVLFCQQKASWRALYSRRKLGSLPGDFKYLTPNVPEGSRSWTCVSETCSEDRHNSVSLNSPVTLRLQAVCNELCMSPSWWWRAGCHSFRPMLVPGCCLPGCLQDLRSRSHSLWSSQTSLTYLKTFA